MSNKAAMATEIKDIALAGLGKQTNRMGRVSDMPVLKMISDRFEKEKPFKGSARFGMRPRHQRNR